MSLNLSIFVMRKHWHFREIPFTIGNFAIEKYLMNLHAKLRQLQSAGRPIRVGVVGTGKFATMFLSQVLRTSDMKLTWVCDLNLNRARSSLQTAGFDPGQISCKPNNAESAVIITDRIDDMIASDAVDVVIESTGDPIAGAIHAMKCIDAGIHLVMVNVEADALIGPMLNAKACQQGSIYSLAYGDQPALIAELVDSIRTVEFDVTCAGKGTKYLPDYHESTPETVWSYYGLTEQQARQGGMNSKMFNSFLDGTKSAIEMAAVSNATGLRAPAAGLKFPACSVDNLPSVLKPRPQGGILDGERTVEVISSLKRDGTSVDHDLRWGVYVVFEAPTDYVRRCFGEYGLVTDESGIYSSLYRPYHLIGLELGVSVASVALRGEPTGAPSFFNADVACIAKKDLRSGERLDGEGGATVWGRLTTAEESIAQRYLPIGLSCGARILRSIAKGQAIRRDDVEIMCDKIVVKMRRNGNCMGQRPTLKYLRFMVHLHLGLILSKTEYITLTANILEIMECTSFQSDKAWRGHKYHISRHVGDLLLI